MNVNNVEQDRIIAESCKFLVKQTKHYFGPFKEVRRMEMGRRDELTDTALAKKVAESATEFYSSTAGTRDFFVTYVEELELFVAISRNFARYPE